MKDYIERISNNLPELPDELKARIMKQYCIPLHDVIVLMNEIGGVKYFEEILEKMIAGDSRLASTIIQEEGLRQLNNISELEKICQEVILQNPKQ
ncbi:4644_t:CDS:2, partial [Racocetra fulgida]